MTAGTVFAIIIGIVFVGTLIGMFALFGVIADTIMKSIWK